MTFKVNPNPTFVGTAKIHVPGEGPQPLKLVFRHMPAAGADEYFRRGLALGADPADPPSSEKFAAYLLEVVAGWEDVDAPFSEAEFVRLVSNYPLSTVAIRDAYFEALGGARRGN